MFETSPHPVVVAVGLDPLEAALGYAAREAARAGYGLHLVHVVHHLAQGPETVLIGDVDLERAGRLSLSAAEELARDMLPVELPVTKQVLWDGVVPSIVAAATETQARMIVVQRRSLSRAARVVTRSVSSGVAAHARIPVVSVPDIWAPERDSEGRPVVTVGVDVPERSDDIVRAALEAAHGLRARLRILHTWSFPAAYNDIISRAVQAEWSDRATRAINEVLTRIGEASSGVEIDVEARHASASDALIEAGRTSELLVVGRHDRIVPLGSHLGPVARAVLREATCPVLLADPAARVPLVNLRRRAGAG